MGVWLCFKLNAWFWWNLCFLSWIWANVHVKQRKNKNVNLHLKLLVSRKIDWERKAWTKKPVSLGVVSITTLVTVRFADAYNFLICLPGGSHIWCGFWDIMGPLLETFYNYFKDDRQDSPLRLLWKRISDEMRQCLQCISQHHQAQDMYNTEYESSSIGPLLDVLQKLDCERVTFHLRDINTKIVGEKYNPSCDNGEVVNILNN